MYNMYNYYIPTSTVRRRYDDGHMFRAKKRHRLDLQLCIIIYFLPFQCQSIRSKAATESESICSLWALATVTSGGVNAMWQDSRPNRKRIRHSYAAQSVVVSIGIIIVMLLSSYSYGIQKKKHINRYFAGEAWKRGMNKKKHTKTIYDVHGILKKCHGERDGVYDGTAAAAAVYRRSEHRRKYVYIIYIAKAY